MGGVHVAPAIMTCLRNLSISRKSGAERCRDGNLPRYRAVFTMHNGVIWIIGPPLSCVHLGDDKGEIISHTTFRLVRCAVA